MIREVEARICSIACFAPSRGASRRIISKHGSWLNIAEIEIGIMSCQALGKPLPDLESFKQQARA